MQLSVFSVTVSFFVQINFNDDIKLLIAKNEIFEGIFNTLYRSFPYTN
jgi:hypothetical protein